jgi:hypothetical protein
MKRTLMVKQKRAKKTVRERFFEVIDCSDFQNVKGANLMIDPLTY